MLFRFSSLRPGGHFESDEGVTFRRDAGGHFASEFPAALGEKIGLPFKLHIHCARHTFGINGLNNGGDIKTISTLMGHSTTLVTEKVYATYLPETLQKTVEKCLDFEI
ncbi:MAG: tyrosine-type recombinase/integrase [Bacteroidales bacterium]|nr:tyrosine-type recombinase/integrase [Bacteroidales bacterium]